MGVIFAEVREGDSVVAIARNAEDDAEDDAKLTASTDRPGEDGRSDGPDGQEWTDSQEDST
jgi:DNA gyrase subunit A